MSFVADSRTTKQPALADIHPHVSCAHDLLRAGRSGYHRQSSWIGLPMRERTIASHFVRAALRGADRQGLACELILRQAGIQSAVLVEPRARIAPEQFSRLMQLLWEALDDEYLGFGRQPSKRGTFAMMGHAIIHCRSLEKP